MAKLSLIAVIFLILFVTQLLAVQSIRDEPAKGQLSNARAITDLNGLRQFLSEFGYLDSYDANIDGLDAFDDKIKSALTLYQMANNLRVTRELDEETIADMEMPRCGVPDISLEGQARPKWPASKTHLTYTFRSTAESKSKVKTQDLRLACVRAFEKWASVSPFTFEEAIEGTSADQAGLKQLTHLLYERDGSNADIEIGFHRGGLGKASAHAYVLDTNRGYIHFDADENWGGGLPQKNEVDLESVALHEIGHLLGLPHSFDRNAVMNSHFMPGTTKRELHGGDVKAIMDLY